MTYDSLGDRMKDYENASRQRLINRIPKVIRIDGKAFHTLLASAAKPYDKLVLSSMIAGAKAVLNEIGGTAKFAYIQSDECSIALNDNISINCSAWFDNNIQKVSSVSASLFTAGYNSVYTRVATFDARFFGLPDLNELINYFIWRQQDATRNSVNQYARTMFSHNELMNKSNSEVQNMMMEKHNFNWNDSPVWTKRGIIVTKDTTDLEIPVFTENKSYISELYLPKPEETVV